MNESIKQPNLNEKREKIEAVFSYENNGEKITFTPDVIVALAGSIVPTQGGREGFGGFKSPSYAELDNKGLSSGGKARVIAAAEAYQFFPDAHIVANSTNTSGDETRPTQAAVYAEELLSYGINEESLIREDGSTTTLTGLIELVRILQKDHGDAENVAVITNEYHVPRVQKMIELLPTLVKTETPEAVNDVENFINSGKKLVAIAAEDILALRDPRYTKLFEKVQETESYKKRVAAEAKGLQALEDGNYNTKLPHTS